MRLSQLEYLVSLHRHGTFSRAAEALYVSQPAISVAIRELEEELGFSLLTRGHKGVEFTPEGEQVLEHARSALREVETIRAIHPERDAVRGTCVIGATPHFCASILLDVKLRLERENPELHIVFRETGSMGVLDELERGALHMGVVQLCDLEEGLFWRRVEELGLRTTELFSEPMCVAVGEHHPLAGRGRVPFEALAAFPYGTYQKAMNQQIRQLLHQVDRPQVFVMDDIGPLRQLLVLQNAYTVIPRRALYYGNQLFRSRLCPLTLRDIELTSPIALLQRRFAMGAAGEAVSRAVIDACDRYLDHT